MLLNQAARFAPVAGLVAEIDGKTLLDVGSGSAGIATWLPKGWEVTAVDRTWSDYGAVAGPADTTTTRVEADARELPFADRSFDVVVSLDVLEHIPVDDRALVLRELGRVVARRLIVACPTGGRALQADRRLREHYVKRARQVPGWLDEHLENGLPEPEELVGLIPGARFLPNENLTRHERLMRLEAAPAGGALSELAAYALRALPPRSRERVSRLLRGREEPPVYRTIAVLDRQ